MTAMIHRSSQKDCAPHSPRPAAPGGAPRRRCAGGRASP
ncbi:hypothetical protein MBEBAB_2554 [Brevundimonas abyssalis TAR-001]|uniref:Uncharacterized protein n=1 Tax=Brevundimonas abyssalis TAR-001 TaxID=1391729 RepID=A0A8E0NDH9_9CAUL|nr:hypothetical protein MBEBAB_2554 [Brevundimonas abyssalis TAR-001]